MNSSLSSYDRGGLLGDRLSFGSPSYPSPLDRIRADRTDFRYAAELNGVKESSFEINQSFPKMTKTARCLDETMAKPKAKKLGPREEMNDIGKSIGIVLCTTCTKNQVL
jgi:hypothetical protein